jgi:hypothetical protein
MTKAGEALDADRLFSYMLETDKGSVIQNGIVLATRQEALERVRSNLRGIRRIQYDWKRQYVTVLSPEGAVLASEGESTAITTAGDTFTAPFAQTVVFVLRAGPNGRPSMRTSPRLGRAEEARGAASPRGAVLD